MPSVTIEIGAYKVVRGEGLLESISLGSCVGVALYDPTARIGGLAHIMLPSSMFSAHRENEAMPTKYADVAIRTMLEAMVAMGAQRSRIVAKMVGGACMFESAMLDSTMNIGKRNSESVRDILMAEKIPIIAEDIGKSHGRTMQFDVASGAVQIRSAKMGNKSL